MKADHAKRREILERLEQTIQRAKNYPATDDCWRDVSPEELLRYHQQYGEFDAVIGDFAIREIKRHDQAV